MESGSVAEGSSENGTVQTADHAVFKLYTRRWFVLVVVCLLNFSNAMMWITFAPISYHTNEYFCEGGCTAATWLNAVFMICSIPFGFLAMWSVDKYGLKIGCLLGGWANGIGGFIRLIASFSFVPANVRFPLLLFGQIVAACGQPFLMYLPTKLAAHWFPDNQRAIANTLASMSNPLGIAAMYALSPLVVNDDHANNFVLLNSIVAGPAVLCALLTLGVISSHPPSPPAASAWRHNVPSFGAGLLAAVRTPSFVILAVCLGGGVGLFNSLYNNLQPTLCINGYSNVFSGVMGSLLIVSGLIGSAISGVFVDKTKKFEETMKVCFAVAGVGASSFAVATHFENQSVWIALSVFCFGMCGFAVYPIGLEMGVETTYPVAEATSSGLIIIMGQLEGVVFLLITSLLATPTTRAENPNQTCIDVNDKLQAKADLLNWKWSTTVWNCIAIVLIISFIVFFWPKYKRMQYEKVALATASTLAINR